MERLTNAAIFHALQPTLRPCRESSQCMKTAKLVHVTFLAAALACAPSLVFASQSSSHEDTARQDMHKAGRDTKNAAKDTGHAVKNGSKHAYHSTRNGTKKGWNKTKSGSKKAWHKTKGATKGAYNGAKNGADTSH
jgi:hypothetical protein